METITNELEARLNDNQLRKLQPWQVVDIRLTYAAGNVSQRSLAAKHGVSVGTVTAIIHRRTWDWL